MNTSCLPAAALALSFAAAPAFGSGADGPTFPSLRPAAAAEPVAPTQVMGAAAPATYAPATGARRVFIAADSFADEPVIKREPMRSRADRPPEMLKANPGAPGHATTPY